MAPTALKQLRIGELSLCGDPANKHALVTIFKSKEPSMTLEQLQAEVTKLTKSVETLTKDKTELQKKCDDMEAERKKKDEEAKKAAEALEKAKTDEVIKIGETEVRKSVLGDSAFAIVKAQQAQLDAQAAEITKANEARELVELTKAAEADYGSLPGLAIDKAAVLQGVAKLAEPIRKTLTEMLKGGEAAMRMQMKERGAAGGARSIDKSGDDPEAKLDKMVDDYVVANKVDKAAAYVEVTKTKAGKDLYAEIQARKSH